MRKMAFILLFFFIFNVAAAVPSHALIEWIVGTIISVAMAERGPDIVSQWHMEFSADLKYKGKTFFSSDEIATKKVVILNKQMFEQDPNAVLETEIVIKPYASDGVQRHEKTEEVYWQVGDDETTKTPIVNGRLCVRLSDVTAKYGIESYPIKIVGVGEDSSYVGIAICQIIFK